MSGYWKELSAADAVLGERALPRAAERRLQRRLGASMSSAAMRGPAIAAFSVAVVVGAMAVVGLQRMRAPALRISSMSFS